MNTSPPAHPPALPSALTTSGTSFSSFGYLTPTLTSATLTPANVYRQPLTFQGQTPPQSEQEHDNNAFTWQQKHPHGPNTSTSSHSQIPSQMQVQVPSGHSSFARKTPLVPTTIDPASAAPACAPSIFPTPPKYRLTSLPTSLYTPNLSHPYNPSYPSSSTSVPYTPYHASPGYATNSTSSTFGPSTSRSYASASTNTQPPHLSHDACPTPTSAYPHPPPSPTPTTTHPPYPHTHSSPHYVPPPTSTSAYTFEDTGSSTTYENQAPVQPVRGHPQLQATLYVISRAASTWPRPYLIRHSQRLSHSELRSCPVPACAT